MWAREYIERGGDRARLYSVCSLAELFTGARHRDGAGYEHRRYLLILCLTRSPEPLHGRLTPTIGSRRVVGVRSALVASASWGTPRRKEFRRLEDLKFSKKARKKGEEMWANWEDFVVDLAREPSSLEMIVAKLLETEGQRMSTASEITKEDELHEEEDLMTRTSEWGSSKRRTT